jgi:GntR family transcriptional repressor for pyruvate dehydrogenase complex
VIPAGTALPPERELARMFGVARRTVQEAVRLLAADGLIESRRGRNGGNFVRPTPAGSRPAAELLEEIRRRRGLIEEGLTYRLELEPAVAARTALVRTTDDLARIARAVRLAADAQDDAAFTEYDTEFHLAVAHGARNRFYAEGVEPVRVLLNDVLAVLPESRLWHERTAGEHAAILGTLEMSDAEGARRAMRAHVAHTDRSVRALLAAL